MKDLSLVLERVYKRLISESAVPSVEGMAAYTYVGSRTNGMTATLYRQNELLNSLRAHSRIGIKLKGWALTSTCSDAIVGHITVKKPTEPCAGAWEVILSAGEDYGKILYGLGYAMSPKGILMSDRSTVSQKAYGGWMKQKGKRNAIELDDIDLPPERQKTPDDPSDDCVLHNNDDGDCGNRDTSPLNYAYEALGWEKGMLKALKEEHEAMALQLYKFDIERSEIERALSEASFEFFRSSYDAEAKAGRA